MARNLQQILLKPVARIAGMNAARQLKTFKKSFSQCRKVQDELLAKLIALHKDSDFGKDHNMGSVKTYEDFKKAVPLQDYNSISPYIQKLLEGKNTALYGDDTNVLMFSMTSGTTGDPKYIPVTERFLKSIRFGWNVFGINTLNQNKKAWLRYILQLSSSMEESQSPCGLPCGAISGLLAAKQKRVVRRMYPTPQWVNDVQDTETRYYICMRYAIERDVTFLATANPSSQLKLIEVANKYFDHLLRDIADGTITGADHFTLPLSATQKRFRRKKKLAKKLRASYEKDGQFLPHHAWDLDFLANWTGGTLKLYLHHLRELFGDLPIYDIGLLASEGRFSLPLEPNTSSGPAEILSNFLEFIPADQRNNENPDTLRADELDVGQEYFLVFSNYTGLMRYNIDDRIRVTGYRDTCPEFEFLSRGLRTASMTGEKITEHQVVEAMKLTAAQLDIDIERFVIQGRFAHPGRPRYELRLELPDSKLFAKISTLMDEKLCELNIEYDSKRKSGRLGEISHVSLPDGTFEAAENEQLLRRHGRAEQYKHQYLITEVLEDHRGEE